MRRVHVDNIYTPPYLEVSVNITKDYAIMKTEVTQLFWYIIMQDNPSRFKDREHCSLPPFGDDTIDSYTEIDGISLCPNHPVDSVTWYDAQEFIKRLNEFEGRFDCQGRPSDPKGCYRLPTEAEWEYAARGGSNEVYQYGTVGKEKRREDLNQYAWTSTNSQDRSHRVATRHPNPYGLFDMLGNVAEWVQDTYNTQLLLGGDDPCNGIDGHNWKVKRGGSAILNFQYSTPERMGGNWGTLDSHSPGFRLVRNL